LQEYDFDVVYRVGSVNWDVDGLSQNLNSNKEDTIKACWHGDLGLEVALKWRAFAYLCTLLRCFKDVS
jgi:hypothetical protein